METKRKIAIGSDHAGFAYKTEIIEHLKAQGFEVSDVGCPSEESCHYPLFAHRLCELITSGECEAGILICGTGIGMSIAANKHAGIRAAVCNDEYTARLTREHNDSNVLCLGARVINLETAEKLVDIFLSTGFTGGNHATRLAMIKKLEDGSFSD